MKRILARQIFNPSLLSPTHWWRVGNGMSRTNGGESSVNDGDPVGAWVDWLVVS